MSHKKKHTVRTHHWYSGILTTKDYIFESLEEALGFIPSVDAHSIKVYDEDEQIVEHVQLLANINTYA